MVCPEGMLGNDVSCGPRSENGNVNFLASSSSRILMVVSIFSIIDRRCGLETFLIILILSPKP